MSFFDREFQVDEDDEDLDEDVEDFDDFHSTYLGGVVPVELLVARSDAAAIAVRRIVAYPDGFEFTLDVWIRKPLRRRRRGLRFGSAILLDLDEIDGELPDDYLRFGIEFPDGARVTNLDTPAWRISADATEPMHGMESHGGGGSDRRYTQEWWAWPVPTGGPLAFVCEWPAYDIPETRAEVEGEVVEDAAARARPVWSDDADRPTHLTRSQLSQALRRRHESVEESPRD